MEKQTINYLLGYKNLKIYQDSSMFKVALDSVLLPHFITLPKDTKKILDIGTGNAPIPLILSTKTKAQIIGVEIQPEVYSLAQQTIKLNKLEKQIELINEDINQYAKKTPQGTFDIIISNPPFFKAKENSNLNKNDYKTIARHEVKLNIEQICKISKKLLKNKGYLGIINRPERLQEILETMKNNKIEPKKIQFIHPYKNKEANMVLIEGRKNTKPGLKILPPIITHKKNGNYTKQIEKYFQ